MVLVTHQIQYLEDCEKILLLKQGKVVACGDYMEITKTGFNIKDILDTFIAINQDKSQSPEKPKEK